MRKRTLIALAGMGALIAVVYAAPAQADTGFCRNVSLGKAECTATAIEQHVDFASFRVSEKSKGRWEIECVKGNHELNLAGKIRGTVRRVLRLSFEQWNECEARIRVRGTRLTDRFGRHVARGGVILLGNQ